MFQGDVGAEIVVFGSITEFANKVNIISKVVSLNDLEIISTAKYSIKKTKNLASLIAEVYTKNKNNKEVTINGNVSNKGFIENLPTNISVEVPCIINGKGIHPLKIGELPPHLSALMMTNINVQQLGYSAILQSRTEQSTTTIASGAGAKNVTFAKPF